MDLMRLAAASFSAIGDIPGSLKGAKEGETEDKLVALQSQIGESLVDHAHDVSNARGSASDLAARIAADKAITDAVTRLMPDLGVDEALSVSLRVCAGCIEGAKPLRDEEMTLDAIGNPTPRRLSDTERQGEMEKVSRKCPVDRVYAAGVSIGPLDKRLRNKQDPVFDGIDQGLLDKHFHEYLRRFPRSS
jgi:hypothetical protein